jgi:hypothetical protein
MCAERSAFTIVHIFPCEPEQVADPQGGAHAQHDHGVIAEITPFEPVICQSVKLFFVPNRFRSHKKIPLFRGMDSVTYPSKKKNVTPYFNNNIT